MAIKVPTEMLQRLWASNVAWNAAGVLHCWDKDKTRIEYESMMKRNNRRRLKLRKRMMFKAFDMDTTRTFI